MVQIQQKDDNRNPTIFNDEDRDLIQKIFLLLKVPFNANTDSRILRKMLSLRQRKNATVWGALSISSIKCILSYLNTFYLLLSHTYSLFRNLLRCKEWELKCIYFTSLFRNSITHLTPRDNTIMKKQKSALKFKLYFPNITIKHQLWPKWDSCNSQ